MFKYYVIWCNVLKRYERHGIYHEILSKEIEKTDKRSATWHMLVVGWGLHYWDAQNSKSAGGIGEA